MPTTLEQQDLRRLHERAVRLSTDAVARVDASRLDIETPCADWDLRALLEHMITQNHGFAAAARGRGDDADLWTVRHSEDPVADYLAASEDVLAAFAAEDVFERPVRLPEIAPGIDIPAFQVIGFHLVDSVVHGWDVARSIGDTVTVDPDVAAEALRIALAVPDDDESRSAPGAAFAPGLETADDMPVLDRILRLLGRSPTWRPVTVG